MTEMGCAQVERIASELALGVAPQRQGQDCRRHLEVCETCRQLVIELSSVAEGLLLLAPEAEPPDDLQDRVLAAIGQAPRLSVMNNRAAATPSALAFGDGGRRRRSPLAVAAAIVLAIALSAGTIVVATNRSSQVRTGSLVASAQLLSATGPVGRAFGYEGHPAWVLITFSHPTDVRLRYGMTVTTTGGRTVPLHDMKIGAGQQAWGCALPVPLSQVRSVDLHIPGGEVLTATFASQRA